MDFAGLPTSDVFKFKKESGWIFNSLNGPAVELRHTYLNNHNNKNVLELAFKEYKLVTACKYHLP